MKIVVLSDIHYELVPTGWTPSGRHTEIADILLERAVRRINLMIRPDLVLVPGDMHNCGGSAAGAGDYPALRKILDKLKAPWVAIPGNHDSEEGLFFKAFPRHAGCLDVAGVRFAFFIDAETPGYNARRSAEDLVRMDHLRDDGWTGPVVMLQHVPLFPPGASSCPYNYDNAPAIIEAMRRNRIGVAISGHYHEGFDRIRDGALSFIAAPALCEHPFSYLVLELDAECGISVARENLAMPSELKLRDMHIHTSLAYCSENMDIRKTLLLAKLFGLDGLCFTEHSGHLYFDSESYWTGRCLEPDAVASPANLRMELYLKMLDEAEIPFSQRGLEIDCRFDCSPLVRGSDLAKVSFLIGAVHYMKSLKDPRASTRDCMDEFMRMNEGLARAGIAVLAHPFRVFKRAGRDVPEELFRPLAQMLRRNFIAAELNCHTNNPPLEFLKICLEEGVKTTFGSDAHNLCEIGEFAPHLLLLRDAGFNGSLNDIMIG